MKTSARSVATADARAELQKNRVVLDALGRQLDASVNGLPRLAGADWKGPAAWAFRVAVDSLRHDLGTAAASLREAKHLTDLAERQVELGG